MAPLGSGGVTVASEIPCQLAPIVGPPARHGPGGPVPRDVEATGWATGLRWPSPLTPVRPTGRAGPPVPAPAVSTGETKAMANTADATMSSRVLTIPPVPGPGRPGGRES